MLALSQATNDILNIAVAGATVAGACVVIFTPFLVFIRWWLKRAIADQIQPLHDRLTAHLDEEADQIKVVGAQLEIIAEHTGAKIPSSLKLR